MPQISLKSNAAALLAQISSDQRELKERAIVRALNRTADNFATAAAREIRKVYNLPQKVARQQIHIRYAHPMRLAAEVIASGYAIPLSEFRATWNRKWAGARFTVKRGSGRKTLPGTFIATMASGHKGVFERTGDKRTPIVEKFSIGVPGMFGASDVQTVLAGVALDRFTVNLEAQLDFLFRR